VSITAHAASRTLRSTVLDALRPALDVGAPPALVYFPDSPNVGDSAIFLGQMACLRALNSPPPCYICDLRTYDRSALARRLGDGPILFGGGGNLGDIWPSAQELRENVIRSFPDNPIIQLPQTIHFESRASMSRARDVLGAHQDFTLYVRDRRSLGLARDELGLTSRLCPDVAFCIDTPPPPREPHRDVLWLMRTDKEAAALQHADRQPTATTGSAAGPTAARPVRLPPHVKPGDVVDWLDEPPSALRAATRLLVTRVRRAPRSRLLRRLLQSTFEPLARQRVRRGLRLLSTARAVITDRLHGHILCLLAGIPHVLLDNNYGKVSAFHETWTRHVHGVHFADSPAAAIEIALRLASDGRTVAP
jgi:pyruvyl transferase EpsO